jgi:hypothetical protein
MATIETISIVFTGISISLAAFYYINTLRNTRKNQELTLKAQEQARETRQAQLLMQIYEGYRSSEFRVLVEEVINQEWMDYDDFWEKYGAINNPVAWSKWGSVAAFFNGVGVLLKKELIDIDLVEELISNQAFVLWVRMEPILQGWSENIIGNRFGEQARSKKYGAYSGFVYLVQELRQREQEYLNLET